MICAVLNLLSFCPEITTTTRFYATFCLEKNEKATGQRNENRKEDRYNTLISGLICRVFVISGRKDENTKRRQNGNEGILLRNNGKTTGRQINSQNTTTNTSH